MKTALKRKLKYYKKINEISSLSTQVSFYQMSS